MMSYKFKEKSQYGDRVVLGAIYLTIAVLAVLEINTLLAADPDWVYAAVCAVTLLVLAGGAYLLNRVRMKVSINEKRIKYKVNLLHKKSKRIAWNQVADCRIERTTEVEQWQGGNLHRPGEAFVSLVGRNGLSVLTKSGQRYFIGCQDVDGLEMALRG